MTRLVTGLRFTAFLTIALCLMAAGGCGGSTGAVVDAAVVGPNDPELAAAYKESARAKAELERAHAELRVGTAEVSRALAEQDRGNGEIRRGLAEIGRARAEAARTGEVLPASLSLTPGDTEALSTVAVRPPDLSDARKTAATAVAAATNSVADRDVDVRRFLEAQVGGEGGVRAAAEIVRAYAETGRSWAEVVRAAAEAVRGVAETERGAAAAVRGRAERVRGYAEQVRAVAYGQRKVVEG